MKAARRRRAAGGGGERKGRAHARAPAPPALPPTPHTRTAICLTESAMHSMTEACAFVGVVCDVRVFEPERSQRRCRKPRVREQRHRAAHTQKHTQRTRPGSVVSSSSLCRLHDDAMLSPRACALATEREQTAKTSSSACNRMCVRRWCAVCGESSHTNERTKRWKSTQLKILNTRAVVNGGAKLSAWCVE